MRAGIVALVVAYMLSQFFRAFLAVLAPVLGRDLGATADDLATASGLWFLAFSLMQLPVGAALDRIGPRLTASVLLGVAGLGVALFAAAASPASLMLAMVLIGAGCSAVLMAAYYIFARAYAPAVFGTLAGVVIGIGSIGNIAASVPLTAAVAAFGWRGTMAGLAVLTLVVALAVWLAVRDPERAEGAGQGSVIDLLKNPLLWPVLVMMVACYAPAAGLRGLWIGPYFADVFAADAVQIGHATLFMGLAMVLGNFAYGPLDRMLGTRKWLIFGGNFAVLVALGALALWPAAGGAATMALICAVGFFGASFPMVVAHGRAFMPPHLVGRGVTLLNLFGIAAVGLMQLVTGRIHAALTPPADLVNSVPPATPYVGLFLFYGGVLALGLMVYLWSTDSTA